MKCSGQIKIIGDEYCGFYSCGLTMLDSSTMGEFREECSEAPNDMLSPLHTVLKSEDGMAINVDYMPDMVNNAAHIQTTFTNNSDKPVTLEMITSFLIEGIKADKIHRFTSFWSAEGRHKVDTVNELNLEKSWNNMAVRVEKFGNVGSMPVRRYFPMVVLEDSSMSMFYGVQLYSPVSWQIEIVCRHDDTLTVAGGIADRDFGNWTKTVGVGETFVVPKAVAAMGRSLEEVCECLVKAQNPNVSPVDNKMGIVFNEYCATWGKPTSENLKTVVDKLEGKDIQFLVIDSGWYGKDDGYWWDYLGDWSINRNRFPNGLKETADYIRSKGMIPGIWFEFESVAPKCELFNQPEHLVKKDGVPLTIGGRRFLDMEDPWVISHLSKNVIDLLKEAGFGYIKVDYNDTMGMGCDGDESLGENLRRKVIATQNFFKKMKEEMPELVIENCSSGGHRLEPSMMELSSQASFSDAHEITSLPLIAANLQKMVKPSQNQIWAVMRAADSDERIYYSMCAPLLGRMGLSGDIYDLSEHQWKLIDEGMSFYKSVSDIIKDGRTVISKADTDSYNNPTGGQAVYRILGKNALIVYHRFGASVDYEEFVKGNNINFPEFDVLSTYGVADKDFSAMAMLVKLRISWDSHMFRENCIIADNSSLRD